MNKRAEQNPQPCREKCFSKNAKGLCVKQYTLCVSVFRFCGGLILDIKRKAPFFVSDFIDAFHIQALSAILFIYLGTVTNAITFGGLLGDATENMQVGLRFEPS